jgi:hypothetical protein
MSSAGGRRQTLSWSDAVGHFQALAREQGKALAPMAALAESLASSRYAASLHPCTDGDVLVLGRQPGFEAGRDELQVRFVPERQRFVFTHRQRPDEVEPWSRDCDAAEGLSVLERLFHRRLHWFHEGAPAPMKPAPRSPDDLRVALAAVMPSLPRGFGVEGESVFTVAGPTHPSVLREFAFFFGKNRDQFTDRQLRRLADLLARCLAAGGPLAEAMEACLLEPTRQLKGDQRLEVFVVAAKRDAGSSPA